MHRPLVLGEMLEVRLHASTVNRLRAISYLTDDRSHDVVDRSVPAVEERTQLNRGRFHDLHGSPLGKSD
jgi:hypothetical protein